ncbi:MAG: bifunctional diaminohydroxyphosphoribosylaminopyrimidine deaminase/5-amino-6-(5-phosphoribosylamino)uracil reductase RibD [Phycisphaerae bacterium]|nr:bifunctional diaminohydroxyphosphoribosylaminopyrimidine deaminase/5-amino-6-(5-phosphoribosylamino)uracil reductase RibD [Phycisphaerae bacterium]
MPDDKAHLDLAARLALRAAGDAEPNPLVGCVLVAPDGRVIGLGHHRRFGGLHAEREAILSCRRQGRDPRGSTAFVTLEPCNGHGKQPPCAEALIEARVARVVFAAPDPSPSKGGGEGRLRAAGVEVARSDASPLASGLAEPWIHRMRTGRPWVIAKWAQTLDGRVATRMGESKWISGEASRRRVHRLRARVDAIVTGLGTVVADDPMLTPRGVRRVRRRPLRVVVDPDLEIPETCALVSTAGQAPTIVACAAELLGAEIARLKRERLEAAGVTLLGTPASARGWLDLRELLTGLHRERGVATVLLECGPGLMGALFEQDLIDEAVVYVAPLVLGDELARGVAEGRVARSLTAGRALRLWRVKAVGGDVELTYRRRSPRGA